MTGRGRGYVAGFSGGLAVGLLVVAVLNGGNWSLICLFAGCVAAFHLAALRVK